MKCDWMHIIINAGKIMLQWQLKQKTPFLSLKKKGDFTVKLNSHFLNTRFAKGN